MQALYRLSRQTSSVDGQNTGTPWANGSQGTAHCPTLTLTRQTEAATPLGPYHGGQLAGLRVYFRDKESSNKVPALVSIYKGVGGKILPDA